MTDSLLFLCVANSARSQLAEGLARQLAPAGTRIWSAGSAPAALNPLAAQALRERDIDPSGQRAKALAEVPWEEIGTVITLCEAEVCPPLADGVRHLHWPMPDPAAARGSEAQRLDRFREVRELIEQRLRGLFGRAAQM